VPAKGKGGRPVETDKNKRNRGKRIRRKRKEKKRIKEKTDVREQENGKG
jgi:hypothetical protein